MIFLLFIFSVFHISTNNSSLFANFTISYHHPPLLSLSLLLCPAQHDMEVENKILTRKYVLTAIQLTLLFINNIFISLSFQMFHDWINLHYWPMATMLHQRISIICHSCKWDITVHHRWWVQACRHISHVMTTTQC